VSAARGTDGIHHVTAIAGDAQRNLDFYAGLLGMRLVKRSVNQDDPGTYHLFYADASGSPGTDLTFFPWPQLAPPRRGVGLTVEVGLAVAPGTLDWWASRLTGAGVRPGAVEVVFGERTLPLSDPDGLGLRLVEAERAFAPWDASPVPADRQVRGLHHVRMWERALEPTAELLEHALGLAPAGAEQGWHRFAAGGGGSGAWVDVRALPEERRGAWGTGAVHHVAWRARDERHQFALRAQVESAGRQPTPVIDRFWFRSVYFLEPGGALFEIATDGPGFAVDEDPAHLGEQLILPPWLEAQRAEIERALPPLTTPTLR
jgi:glyoxalase family protein